MKTLDHALMSTDLERAAQNWLLKSRAVPTFGWVVASNTKRSWSRGQNSMVGGMPAQERCVHAQPRVSEQGSEGTKEGIQKKTRNDTFDLEGEDRRADKRRTDELVGYSENPGPKPRMTSFTLQYCTLYSNSRHPTVVIPIAVCNCHLTCRAMPPRRNRLHPRNETLHAAKRGTGY